MKRIMAFALLLILLFTGAASGESAAAKLQEIYAEAELLMATGDYAGAAAKFEALGAYSDAQQMSMYCKAVWAAEQMSMFDVAIAAFTDLGDFRDSRQMADYYAARKKESIADSYPLATASDSSLDFAKKQYDEAITAYAAHILYKDCMTRMASCQEKLLALQAEQAARAEAKKEETYQAALALEAQGEYQEAYNRFSSIRDYKDSADHVAVCLLAIHEAIYQQAVALEAEGKYEDAAAMYTRIKSHKDSQERLDRCNAEIRRRQEEAIYQKALALEQQGKYEEAIKVYKTIQDYGDSAERISFCQQKINAIIAAKNAAEMSKYIQANEKKAEGRFSAALALYQTIDQSSLDQQTADNVKNAISSLQAKIKQSKYDAVSYCSDGMIEVIQNKKYGFANQYGWLVIPCEYSAVDAFSEGLARVKKDGKWGFINKTGKIVIACKYDYAGSFHEGLALIEKNGKYGYIDQMGKEVITPKVDDAFDFSEGLAPVVVKGKKGYIDKTGKIVISTKYAAVGDFHEGMAVVATGIDSYLVIDSQGKTVFKLKQGELGTEFSEGMLLATRIKNFKGVAEAFYNKAGKSVILLKNWDWAEEFHNGLSAVRDSKNLWGFINTSGKTVISAQYDSVGLPLFGFCDAGVAVVKKNGKWGVIDQQNKTVVPFSYESGAGYSEGVAVMLGKDKQIVLFDTQGNRIEQ